MKVETLSIPHLIRYGLTGLLAIALLGLIPAALSKPELLKSLESLGSMAGVWAAGIVAGFLLDALKLYQFSPGYTKGRDRLRKKVLKANQR